jgi:hypothetical protein
MKRLSSEQETRRRLIVLLHGRDAEAKVAIMSEVALLRKYLRYKKKRLTLRPAAVTRVPRHPRLQSSWAAIAIALLGLIHVPCFTDWDCDRHIGTFQEEIAGLLAGGPRWTHLQNLIWRYSDEGNREYLRSVLKT